MGNSSGWTWAATAAGLVKLSGRPFLFCQFLFFLSRLQTKLVAVSSSSLSFLSVLCGLNNRGRRSHVSFRGTLCVVCTRDVSSRTPCMFLLLHGEEFYHWVGCHDRLIHSEVWKIGSKQAWRPDLHFMFTGEGERWAVVTHDGGKHWEAKHTLGVKKGREAGRHFGFCNSWKQDVVWWRGVLYGWSSSSLPRADGRRWSGGRRGECCREDDDDVVVCRVGRRNKTDISRLLLFLSVCEVSVGSLSRLRLDRTDGFRYVRTTLGLTEG